MSVRHSSPGEVKLYTTSAERDNYDNLADLFAIMRTTEAVEKAHLRDSITSDEYAATCTKLIKQFKAAQHLTQLTTPEQIQQFMRDYKLDCKAAYRRLVVEQMVDAAAAVDDSAKTIAETVQFFITAMDSLKLEMTAVDQIYPLLNDLYQSLSKISSLPPDWDGKVKIKKWLTLLNSMKAHDELNDEQVRQVLFDLDSAYTAFHASLASR
mmetsp:Transcript_32702/g.80099  ORF Transcript_32702/g.80099 Transcript_32702/m.80099 type:complete len:210 (+) Transcript_32702:127-756(+)